MIKKKMSERVEIKNKRIINLLNYNIFSCNYE